MTLVELNHISLHVRDLAASIRFYRDVLALEPLDRPAFDFAGAWFRLGSTQELHLIAGRTNPVHSHNQGTHFALQVVSVAEVVRDLEEQGIQPIRAVKKRPDGVSQVFFADPDGYYIEFFEANR